MNKSLMAFCAGIVLSNLVCHLAWFAVSVSALFIGMALGAHL